MEVLLFIWQFPQMILGLLLRLVFRGSDKYYKYAIVRRSTKMRGGIALGKYIIINQWMSEDTVRHEYGHYLQSRKLGWFYLLIVGIPSLLWAAIYGRLIKESDNGYYEFFTERWADRLGGVER